ncbi:MAG TPA: hypothetical protein PK054_02980 [Anaerohalosphaeraceae bacterium]|mgnify:CR=1 FL=1|nr:hypothetical protein [Anaerohalosphaeraceae bacterium]HOL89940.1 hypothetical protein [Anaerohalosphaeraceae bacterium]HPP55525.1 hypothetical protein [Anaerohalosphaeraceae bacterium]
MTGRFAGIRRLIVGGLFVYILFFPSFGEAASGKRSPESGSFFVIRVVDEQTGRGVPLIELKTTNGISFWTDSQGVIAFFEPGLMGQEVYFSVRGPGYDYPADGFGNHGVRLKVREGETAQVRVRRVNVAERLYRITGQGIYRDSLLAGLPVPLKNPDLNGQVMGQDSVQTCWYKDRLYWFWGDTNCPFYPLGNFATSGAVSLLPRQGGLDPSVGVDLHYFTDERGFCKKMVPLPEEGVVWIEGVCSVKDSQGKEHMTAFFSRRKGLAKVLEYGLLDYDDSACQFRPVLRSEKNLVPFDGVGHPFGAVCGAKRYFYFAVPFPLGVRMRISACWDDMLCPERYEVYTALGGSPAGSDSGAGYWISLRELQTQWKSADELKKALQKERQNSTLLYDVRNGASVVPHNGSVSWNAYRRKWILIAVQQGGESSYLGEVWYAEADTPAGPWGYAQKVVSHERYSFYNPKHHPYFDQEGGRIIYFEGTYSFTFSGSAETAVPRYDYNQIMYRLDLSAERLRLPEPVYEIHRDGGVEYLFGSRVRTERKDGKIAGIAFWAVSPERAFKGLIPIYAERMEDGQVRLSKESGGWTGKPLFYAMPAGTKNSSRALVPLFEYRHKETGLFCYSVETQKGPDWEKGSEPLCLVWKNPAEKWTADWEAQPWTAW